MRDAEVVWSGVVALVRCYEDGVLIAIEEADDWDSAQGMALAWESYDLEVY